MKTSTKALPKVNARRKTKRKAKQAKHYASKEYKAARAEAMERAGGRCEYFIAACFTWDGIDNSAERNKARCPITEGLEAHHKRYPKTRPLTAKDLFICCQEHHALLESFHPTRGRRF